MARLEGGVDLEQDGPVFALRLDAGENRFSPGVIDGVDRALDEVEKAGSPAALVTVGSGRFYSNGLDLEHMAACGDPGDYLARVLAILARVLAFPANTVAAVNGHAFGAGALLALCHDVRLMRADRGFFCMPEIDMRVHLHPGMTAILRARLPSQTAHDVIVTGRRFGGEEACARGIVDLVAAEDALLPRARAIAAELAPKADPAMRMLKRGLYAAVLEDLARPLATPSATG